MPSTQNFAGLDRLLKGLSGGVPHQQNQLDEHYEASLNAFGPVLEAASTRGHETLARAIAPSAMVIDRVSVEASFRFADRREHTVEAGVHLIDLGYKRRFVHAAYAQNTVCLEVHRIPLPLGSSPQKTPSALPQSEEV